MESSKKQMEEKLRRAADNLEDMIPLGYRKKSADGPHKKSVFLDDEAEEYEEEEEEEEEEDEEDDNDNSRQGSEDENDDVGGERPYDDDVYEDEDYDGDDSPRQMRKSRVLQWNRNGKRAREAALIEEQEEEENAKRTKLAEVDEQEEQTIEQLIDKFAADSKPYDISVISAKHMGGPPGVFHMTTLPYAAAVTRIAGGGAPVTSYDQLSYTARKTIRKVLGSDGFNALRFAQICKATANLENSTDTIEQRLGEIVRGMFLTADDLFKGLDPRYELSPDPAPAATLLIRLTENVDSMLAYFLGPESPGYTEPVSGNPSRLPLWARSLTADDIYTELVSDPLSVLLIRLLFEPHVHPVKYGKNLGTDLYIHYLSRSGITTPEEGTTTTTTTTTTEMKDDYEEVHEAAAAEATPTIVLDDDDIILMEDD